ncbi:putative transposase [Methylobacterium gregans]|nr:putative transposase [Methylobacterium gregans]
MSWAIEEKGYSQRRACGLIGVAPKTYRYASTRGDDAAVRVRLRSLAGERRRFGYRRLLILLRREGLTLNHKKLFRLYREERLSVRKRGGRKRALGSRAPAAVPQEPNQRWSLDFVSDTLDDGRRFRILVVVDDCTRECLALVVDTSLSGRRVARELDRIIVGRGKPLMIVSDNVLRSDEGRLARQQVSVREHAPAVCLSSTSIQAAPADPEELSAIANTGSSRCTRHRGPHRPQHEMSIQAGDPSIIYRVVVLTPSRLC